MSQKQELWLAFAGDELTCVVSVVNRTGLGGNIDLELAGTITSARAYIYDLIMDVVENADYDTVTLNVRKLVFFTGHIVNDCAIEELLKLVYYFTGNGKKLNILLEDGCVKDVLQQDLAGKSFDAVTLTDSQRMAAIMVRPSGVGAPL